MHIDTSYNLLPRIDHRRGWEWGFSIIANTKIEYFKREQPLIGYSLFSIKQEKKGIRSEISFDLKVILEQCTAKTANLRWCAKNTQSKAAYKEEKIFAFWFYYDTEHTNSIRNRNSFTFHYGSIMTEGTSPLQDCFEFTFHYGSIMTYCNWRSLACFYIYIPLWFYYDDNAMALITSFTTFTFHYGSIMTNEGKRLIT